MKRDYSEHIGKQNVNKNGTTMTIIEFKNAEHIKIQFEDEHKYTKDTTYSNFARGVIKNPYDKTICGVAFTGDGIHKISIKNKLTIEYKTWHNMIGRCFVPQWQKQQKTYVDCTVCNEWLNFQNFAQWYKDNWYEVEGERMELDKDILIKNNKIYSPETCCFVPKRMNLLIINRKNYRGDTPLGVRDTDNGSFHVTTNDEYGKLNYLGTYHSEKLAFNTYKNFRENVYKKVANIYKDRIPLNLYNALYNRKIEITD